MKNRVLSHLFPNFWRKWTKQEPDEKHQSKQRNEQEQQRNENVD
jgi:hypothetical protein